MHLYITGILLVAIDILYLSFKWFLKNKKIKNTGNVQEYMRKTQADHIDGAKTFVYLSSSWNHLPKLPIDINQKIYETCTQNLNGHLWCEVCKMHLLIIEKNQYLMKQNYACINNKYKCYYCREDKYVRSNKQINNILL